MARCEVEVLVRAAVIGAAVLTTASAVAQQGPVRDANSAPTVGTAALSGVVVSDEERPQPVRRAIVTLTGEGLRPSRGAITDDAGRFAIANLPGGKFTLTVSRATYITSVYGAKRPGRPGTPIAVADSASVTNLSVKMWRAAVVAGTVRDVSGAPMPGIPVRAIPAKPQGTGTLASLTNNGGRTNELGEFRIFGLEPGLYVVCAEATAGVSQLIALREAEVDAMLEALKRRTTLASAPAPVPPSSKPFDFAPVYYPAAISIAQAAPLTLAAGQEVGGLDITLQRVQRSTLTGTVMRPDGTPAAGAAVQLTPELPVSAFSGGAAAPINTTAAADGSFRISQVAPGTYQVMARAAAGPPPPPTPGFVTPGPVGPQLWASSQVSVGSTDIDGLSMTLAPGLTVRGRVVFRSSTLPAPQNPNLRVTLVPPSVVTQRPGTAVETIAFVPGVAVRPDGTFDMPNMPPGVFRLFVTGTTMTSGEWLLESALMGERDLLDNDFELSGGGTTALTITLSDKSTELSGTIQSASGAPVSDVFVIAFTPNRTLWGTGARRVQAVRPAVDGRYVIKGLPPGDYLVSALLDVDENDWNQPGFLDQIIPASIKIAIADGEKKTQNLRIGR